MVSVLTLTTNLQAEGAEHPNMSTPTFHPWPPGLPKTKLCGCCSFGTPRPYYLPLLDSEIHTTILCRTFKTVLKQTFVKSLSAKSFRQFMYELPLYAGISVVEFNCKIGTKPALRSLVKEKGNAQADFDATVVDGDNVNLPAQAPQSSNVFTTRIGNVEVGESIFVEITYVGELKHDDDIEGIRFMVPNIIAPVYGVTEAIMRLTFAELERISPLGHDGIRITVDIILPAGQYIQEIESPSHLVSASIGGLSIASQEAPVMNKAFATFSLGSTELGKDFFLIIHVKNSSMPTALLETHPTISNHRAMMITLAAPLFHFSSYLPSEIILVVDRSASMRHDIPMLVSVLKVFLKSFPTSVRFNICSFGTENTFLWPQSNSYTNSTLQEAIQHISTFKADYGGTEILKAIQATIERRVTDLPLDVILFTNGNITDQGSSLGYVNEEVEKARNITNQEALFTSVREKVERTKQRSIRVFSLGIGNKFSHALVEGIARAGQGLCIAVRDGERLEKSVTRMLRGALSPHYEDGILEVNYGQDDDDFELVEVTEIMENFSSSEAKENTTSLSGPSSNFKDKSLREIHHFPQIIQAPHKIPSLLTAGKLIVYMLIGPKTIQRNPTSVILRSPFVPALEIPIEMLTERGTTIHHLAARKVVQDMEESHGWVFDNVNKITDVQNLVGREAVRLGEAFQVANKWCSFATVSSTDGMEIFTRTPTLLSDLGAINPYDVYIDPPRKLLLEEPPQPDRFAISSPSIPEIQSQQQRTVKVTGYSIRRRKVQARSVKAAGVSSAVVTDTTAPSISAPDPDLTKVLGLIDLQCFDGAWNIDSEKPLLDIMGFEIPRPPLNGLSDRVWVTMLVVRFLEDRMLKEEDVWGIVVEKAREYVRKCMETRGDLHLLEKLAGVVVGNGKNDG